MNAYPVSFNLDIFNCRCKHRHEIAKWGKVGKQYWILSSSHISTHPRVQKVNARFYIQPIPFLFVCFNEQTKTAQRKYKFLPSGISWSSTGFEIRSPPSATDKKTSGTKRGKFNAASHVCFVEAVCDWFKTSGVRLFPLITKQTWYFVVDKWWNALTQTLKDCTVYFSFDFIQNIKGFRVPMTEITNY